MEATGPSAGKSRIARFGHLHSISASHLHQQNRSRNQQQDEHGSAIPGIVEVPMRDAIFSIAHRLVELGVPPYVVVEVLRNVPMLSKTSAAISLNWRQRPSGHSCAW